MLRWLLLTTVNTLDLQIYGAVFAANVKRRGLSIEIKMAHLRALLFSKRLLSKFDSAGRVYTEIAERALVGQTSPKSSAIG